MTDNTAHNEDLSPDITESEAISGGASSHRAQSEMNKLESEGYAPGECTAEGTMMVNPKTHQKKLVRY